MSLNLASIRAALALIAAIFTAAMPLAASAAASGVLQCAPYAREVSGIALHGRAADWWDQANGLYDRGSAPKVGAVLAFRATHTMRAGHVAMVSQVINQRHVMLNHANWSRPGMIERSAMAVDVSDAGDWSQVRVYYAPIGGLGLRASPAFGFIYPAKAEGVRMA